MTHCSLKLFYKIISSHIFLPFFRTVCISRGVLQRAGLDWTGSICGVQPHYHLSGAVCWGIPVCHFHHQSPAGAATDNRWAFMSRKGYRRNPVRWKDEGGRGIITCTHRLSCVPTSGRIFCSKHVELNIYEKASDFSGNKRATSSP